MSDKCRTCGGSGTTAAAIIRRHLADLETPTDIERRRYPEWWTATDAEAARARAELARRAQLRLLRQVLAEVEAETGVTS